MFDSYVRICGLRFFVALLFCILIVLIFFSTRINMIAYMLKGASGQKRELK